MTRALSILGLFAIITITSSFFHQQKSVWTGPNGWGISEDSSNYKRITNLKAPNWIMGSQTIEEYNKGLFEFITNNNVTKCPLQTPFLRGSDSQCIQCKNPTAVFDLFKKDCISCPTGTQLNPGTHKCEKTQAPKPTNKCTSNYIWSDSQDKCVCPNAFPIDLGCQCVKCLQPFIWNAAEKACKLRCQETHIWNKQSQKCECPKLTPYEVNGECISCNTPFQWKAESNICQLKVNPCTGTLSNTTSPTTPSVQTCTSNFVWDSIVKQCVCPSNLPFNDGKKCLECNLPQYWDHTLKQCLYCQQDQYFNTLSRVCEGCPVAKPLWKNYGCQACPNDTTYNKSTKSCERVEQGFDPSVVNKVPVQTKSPSDGSFIDPSITAKVPTS